MKCYEIYDWNGRWEIWEWDNNGGRRIKIYKTRKGAESWAKKCWYRVIWR